MTRRVAPFRSSSFRSIPFRSAPPRSAVAACLLLALCGNAAAQQQPHATLAERLMSLRQGWTLATDQQKQSEPAAPAKPQEAAIRGAVVPAMGPGQAVVSDAQTSLPRVDPRDLLPRTWTSAEASDAAGEAAAGTARSRLMREMRGGAPRGQAVATDSRRPAPRAGSALSEQAPMPAPTTHSTGALARSIAADVAKSLSPTPAPAASHAATTDPATLARTAPTASDAIARETTPKAAQDDSFAPLLAPASPAQAPPALTRADDDQAGAARGGSVSLAPAASKPTERLPLVIGPSNGGAGSASTIAAEGAPRVAKPKRAAATSNGGADLLLSQPMPMLISRVSGPRSIVVGRDAEYHVYVANRGEAPADKLVTRVSVPAWAEVVSTSASSGAVQRESAEAEGESLLVWRMDQLGEGVVADLTVRLVARTGRPIELGVTCEHDAIDSHAMVEVQEPKLAMDLAGPEDVLFGKPQMYRLTLTNPGTGPAENVVLRLTPPGGDAGRAVTHPLGAVAAGESRSIEIELTAREAGQLAVAASAIADGGVTAECVKQVRCRKAELEVDWRGPTDRYAGAPMTYYFRVQNTGTASASDVELTVELPEGFHAESGPGPQPVGGRVAYRVGSLEPGQERFFELRGSLARPGANAVTIRAASPDGAQSAEVTGSTEVVALADLKLDILDPPGPVATGAEVVYEVRVTNRGESDAHEVKVVGFFSDGIEPERAEGGACDIRNGRVVMETIGTMPAGAEKTIRIFARAHQEGVHLFRAQVECRDLEIKLAAEETTRFFQDEAFDMASGAYKAR